MAGFNDNDGLEPNIPIYNTSDSSPGGLFEGPRNTAGAGQTAAAAAADAKKYAEEAEAAAARADSDAERADSDAAVALSAAERAEAAADRADSDSEMARQWALISKSWAVGPNGGGNDTEMGTDTDNAKYWYEQTLGVAVNVAEGEGIIITQEGDTEVISVDTDTIATRDWVEDHVTGRRYIIGNGLDTEDRLLFVDTDYIADTDWVKSYVATHGGHEPAHVNVNVSFNSSAVLVGSAINRTATVTVSGGTFSSISNATASQGTATISSNTVALSVSSAEEGTVRMSFIVHYTDAEMVSYSKSETVSITVRPEWYTELTNTQPTDTSSSVSQGAFVTGDEATLTNSGADTLQVYVWVPTDDVSTAQFETTTGFDIPFTNLGVTSGDHTLVRFTGSGIEAGDTNTIRVREV